MLIKSLTLLLAGILAVAPGSGAGSRFSASRPSAGQAPTGNSPTPNEFSIPTPGSGTFLLTAGPDGNLWFCETKTDKIGRVTPGGLFTEFPLPGGSGPYAITGGPDGNLWFTEQGTNSIGRISPTGTNLFHFPIPSPGSQPWGMTNGPDGNLWFTEGGASKIGKVTTSGSFTEFPLPVTGTNPFLISPGPNDGNVWFTEPTGNFVSRITPSGTITQFPVPTANSYPYGITAGPDGRMWYTEYGANKIGRVSSFGVFAEYPIPTPNSFPFAITAPGDGNLYYTQQGTNAVQPFLFPSQMFGSLIPTSEGPSGITTLKSATGNNLFVAFVTADANRFGGFSLIAKPPDCTVTLNKPFRSFDAKGKPGAIDLGNSNCEPKATSEVDWIEVDSVGFRPDTHEYNVVYHVLPNTSPDPRFGEIKIGDKYFGVNQAGATPLPPVNPTQRSATSGGSGFKMTVRSGGGSEATITIEAAGFTANSIVGWDGEDRPTTLVSSTQLSADISADDIATPGTVRVTVFDPSPSGGTSPDVTFTIITAGPDFSLGFDSPTVTGQAGTKARVTVNINRTGGFTGAVTVTPPPPANGIKPKPPDPITTTDASASFKMKIGGGVSPGQYPLTFTAQDGSGKTRTGTVTLVVQP